MTLNNNRPPCREIGLRGVLLIALCVVVVSAAFGLGVRAAGAHGNPEVRIEPNPVAFEGEVTIEGEGFEEETAVSLVLEGVLGETSLGTASTDPEGAFAFTVTLPSTAAPGSYRIRAVGHDDVRASINACNRVCGAGISIARAHDCFY